MSLEYPQRKVLRFVVNALNCLCNGSALALSVPYSGRVVRPRVDKRSDQLQALCQRYPPARPRKPCQLESDLSGFLLNCPAMRREH